MIKCDLCADRREMGLDPACVHTCFYDALEAGPLNELATIAREKIAKRLAGSTQPSLLLIQ
jgi:Fe-S-cluster-containing dehydrogenase component